MEEHYEETVLRRNRKKKLRVGRVIFFLLFLFIIGILIYSIIQFKIGQSITGNKSHKEEPFEGDPVSLQYPSVENYLLLGTDQINEGEKARTDTMIVLSLNKEDNKIKLVSLMRDIYAEIPGYKSYKLNTAYYLGGVQTTKDTISGMFGIPIHHYAIVNFENFESFVDLAFPAGVEIEVKKEMSEKIGVTLTPGTKRLNGKELLGYTRFRADSEGDFGRVARQQEALAAMKKEATQLSTVIKSPKIIGGLSNLIETDLSEKDQIIRILPFLVSGDIDVESLTIPVEGTYSFNFYEHAGSVIEVNLEENRQAIIEFLNIKN